MSGRAPTGPRAGFGSERRPRKGAKLPAAPREGRAELPTAPVDALERKKPWPLRNIKLGWCVKGGGGEFQIRARTQGGSFCTV